MEYRPLLHSGFPPAFRSYVELGHSSVGHVQLEPALLILAIADALN